MFTLQFDMRGDAFAGNTYDAEIARILEEVCDSVMAGYFGGPILDVNGNRIGQWEIEEEEDQ